MSDWCYLRDGAILVLVTFCLAILTLLGARGLGLLLG